MKWKQSVLIIAALCIVSAMVLVMMYTQPREGKDGLPTSSSPEHNCSTSFITRDLCDGVQEQRTPGAYCSSLCSGDVKDIRCIGHGKVVFFVQYSTHSVILKELKRESSVEVKHHFKYMDKNAVYKGEHLDHHIVNSLRSVGVHSAPYESIKQTILKGCDKDLDNEMTYSEFALCLQIVYTEEYIINVLLDGYVGIPKVYGTCGRFFSVQYAGDPLLSRSMSSLSWSSMPPWKERALVALDFLNIIEVFEKTPFGVLFLCDLQYSNFGVEKNHDGNIHVLATDMDISFFERAMYNIITQGDQCEKDKDCDFFSCSSKCAEGKCTKKLHSSNLQVLCYEIFTARCDVKSGLLQSPPQSIDTKLVFLLQECCHPQKLLYYWNDTLVHSPLDLLTKIRDLLKHSL